MCGIFAYLGEKQPLNKLLLYFIKTSHRGPDNSKFVTIKKDLFFGFHRLRINGLDTKSDQPFHLRKCHLICNGEIYNFKELIEKYKLEDDYYSNSDCEIIIHLYKKLGIHKTLEELDGVFSFMLYDEESNEIIAARDPLGIRPLFMGKVEGELAFSSEAKSISFCDSYKQFPPGKYWTSSVPDEFVTYYDYNYPEVPVEDEEEVCRNIREKLTTAVKKRLMGERDVGCLLSGGLDSTLVTALVCKHYGKDKVKTYSIGLQGSVDLYWAKKASEYLGTDHHEICLTEKEFLDAIPKTVMVTESFCTTTIRASVGNHLVSLYIKEHTDDTVIYCGDVADEIFGSYRGFMKAPSDEEFRTANEKIVRDVHLFDVLRSDRSISGAGLEARVPFADKELVEYVMSLPSKYKTFDDTKIEKYYLRKAFEGYLPQDLLYRRKEAFSDGVSSQTRSWCEIIKDYADEQITDESYEKLLKSFSESTNTVIPYDKESMMYRYLYHKFHPSVELVPYYWRHPFCAENADPSARLLDFYTE
tara:strand:+ start:3413 stop:4999 length:1587 start_codon:yes stop_codon:yes gene_type:complete